MAIKTIPAYPNYKISNLGAVTTQAGVPVPSFIDNDGLEKVQLSTITSSDVISIQTLLWMVFKVGTPTPAGDDKTGETTLWTPPISSQRKKMGFFDQDPPSTTFVKANIRQIEARPYDAMVIAIPATDPVMGAATQVHNRLWTGNVIAYSAYASAIAELNTTDFRQYQYNAALAGTHTSRTLGEPPASWFDPAAMEAVYTNFAVLGEVIKNTVLYSMFFDPEPDHLFSGTGWSIWKYAGQPWSLYSFARCQEQVRHCGRRWMEKIQEKNPNLIMDWAFLYEQGNADPELAKENRNYGLYNSFLDGVYDVKLTSIKFRNFFESSYNYKTLAKWTGAEGKLLADNPQNVGTTRYDKGTQRSGVTMPDYPKGTTYDTVTLSNNYFPPAELKAAVKYGLQGFSEDMFWIRSEQIKNATIPTTFPAAIDQAIRDARVESFIQMETGFDIDTGPALVPGLFERLSVRSLPVVADDSLVSSAAGLFSVTFTGSGSTRPKYKVNSGHPSLKFESANSTVLIGDALAPLWNPSGLADLPLSAIVIAKPNAVNATAAFFSLGRAATSATLESLRIASNGGMATQRQDDAGSSIVTSSSASALDTSLQGLAMVSTGIGAGMYRNGVQLVSDPLGQDVTAMHVDIATIGATRTFGVAATHLLNADIYEILWYRNALSIEQIRWLLRGFGAYYGYTVTA